MRLIENESLENGGAVTVEKTKDVDTANNSTMSENYAQILRSKMVLLALFGTMFSATVQGFLESFLEEYLKIFGLSVTQIGLSFLCMSVPYMFATPMWGWLVDKYIQPEIVNPIGHLTIAASLLLIGPVDYIGLVPSYLITMIGLGVVGVGTAATITSTFALSQKHALLVLGEGSSSEDYSSLISGLWTAAFALGNFVGPTAGGPLVDWLGFTGTTPIIQVWEPNIYIKICVLYAKCLRCRCRCSSGCSCCCCCCSCAGICGNSRTGVRSTGEETKQPASTSAGSSTILTSTLGGTLCLGNKATKSIECSTIIILLLYNNLKLTTGNLKGSNADKEQSGKNDQLHLNERIYFYGK